MTKKVNPSDLIIYGIDILKEIKDLRAKAAEEENITRQAIYLFIGESLMNVLNNANDRYLTIKEGSKSW